MRWKGVARELAQQKGGKKNLINLVNIWDAMADDDEEEEWDRHLWAIKNRSMSFFEWREGRRRRAEEMILNCILLVFNKRNYFLNKSIENLTVKFEFKFSGPLKFCLYKNIKIRKLTVKFKFFLTFKNYRCFLIFFTQNFFSTKKSHFIFCLTLSTLIYITNKIKWKKINQHQGCPFNAPLVIKLLKWMFF